MRTAEAAPTRAARRRGQGQDERDFAQLGERRVFDEAVVREVRPRAPAVAAACPSRLAADGVCTAAPLPMLTSRKKPVMLNSFWPLAMVDRRRQPNHARGQLGENVSSILGNGVPRNPRNRRDVNSHAGVPGPSDSQSVRRRWRRRTTTALTKYAPSGKPVLKTCVLRRRRPVNRDRRAEPSTPRSSRWLLFHDPLDREVEPHVSAIERPRPAASASSP